MPSAIPGQAVTYSYEISSDLMGNYTITVNKYNFGELVDTSTYDYDTGSDEIIGIIQRQFPDDYATIIDVNSANLNGLNHNVTGVGGLKLFCANCSSLVHVSIQDFTYPTTGPFHNEYAFYNCSALYIFVAGDIFNRGIPHNSAHMFEGCSTLAQIGGNASSDAGVRNGYTEVTIDMSQSLTLCKDMFKGCTSLTGVTLINGTDDNDLTAQQIIDGTTYEYGYEYLGITSEMISNFTIE